MSEFRVKANFGSPSPLFAQVDPCREAFARLRQAEELRLAGQLDRARSLCDVLVRDHPNYMAALHTLGLVHLDKAEYERALDCLVRAAMHDPENSRTLTALSAAYLRLGATEIAAQTLERARKVDPADVSVLLTLGEIYTEEREYELAREVFDRILTLEPDLAAAKMGLATALSYLGEFEEAARVLESMIACGQRSLDVLVALASLPASVVKVDLLSELGKIAGPQLGYDPAEVRSFTAFVRAAALDRASRATEAWQEAGQANRVIFTAAQRRLGEATERQRASLERLRQHPPQTPAEASTSDGAPISLFILGASRSGKTTLERLVGTLDGVKRGHENLSIDKAVRRAFHTAGLLVGRFETLPPEFHPLCCELYRKEIVRRAGPARIFTNTIPARIHDAALVASIFPSTRFIFVKRNLEDNLLRMFMRKYAEGNVYSYDLRTARDHLVWYDQMIDLLAQKLPSVVRVVRYEDMIVDPASALRVAADLCGLQMPERCELPAIGDDRGCAAPYRALIQAELGT